MTILTELARLYERRALDETVPEEKRWPLPGFSMENIGAEVVLDDDGAVLRIRPLGVADAKGKMRQLRRAVPAIERTSGIRAGLFWDKTAYALGVTATVGDDGKATVDEDGNPVPGQGKRTVAEHQAFREAHLALLEGADDPGLRALCRFVETWRPEMFAENGCPPAIIDANVVFRHGEAGARLHETEAARALLTGEARNVETDMVPCLVTGDAGAVVQLHPKTKGVMGAQSSGASLVSFNASAFESHGKKQGDNAPVSKRAAFAYGTALNGLLEHGSGNTLRVGDATVVFWADGSSDAEAVVGAALGQTEGEIETEVGAAMTALSAGQPSESGLDPGSRFFLLGLAPNAARLSVRFWHETTLGDLARHVTRFWDECAIEPSPFRNREGVLLPPKPWSLLHVLAQGGKGENVPPRMGGELMRAILTGRPYPRTLLSAAIGRIRAEGEDTDKPLIQKRTDGQRAALIRAVLLRGAADADVEKKRTPMALDENATDPPYLLGRLFGAYVYAERSHQPRGASLRDKYLGAASATPARVFPILMRGYEHNLSALMKAGGSKAGSGVVADKAVARIIAALPGGGDLPGSLPIDDQGRFFIGFYHQLSAFYAKAEDAATTEPGEGDDA